MDHKKLQKVKRLMELTKGNMTTKSFYGAFEKVVGHILKAEKRLMDRSDNKTKEEKDNLANLSIEFKEIMAVAKSDSSKTFGTIRKRTVEAIDKMFVKNDVNKRLKKELDKVTSVLANIKDGEPGKPGKQGKPGERGDPGPPGEAADEKEIVETVLARIQIPVIDYKRFDDFESKMREELRKGKRIMTPARPTVVNLKDTLIINVTDNEVLAYDSASGAWINQTLAEAGIQGTTSGSLVNVTRITGNTTLNTTHHHVASDTDGGGITVTLPAGVVGTEYRIINTGTSGNVVTITPNGSELLIGVNSSFTLNDGESLIISYESTEGWN